MPDAQLSFEIHGTRDGKPGRWKIRGANINDAKQRAAKNGVKVLGAILIPTGTAAAVAVAPAPAPTPAPLTYAVEDPEPEPETPEPDPLAQLGQANVAPPISYATPETPRRTAPSYGGITRGAFVLRIFAGIEYAAGGLTLLAALLMIFAQSRSTYSYGGAEYTIPGAMIIGGLINLAFGALLSMAAAVGVAIRDTAINSFNH